jgi:ribosomal protein S18 acetylase RimI-like enzyme
VIRRADPDEAELLARLSIAAWRETYAGRINTEALATLEDNPHHSIGSWAQRLARPLAWTFVAEHRAPVGFVHCRASSDEPGYLGEIERIYMLRSAHGRGLGRALMAAAAETLQANGLAPFLLWVMEFNAQARRFYEHLGGAALRRQRFQLGAQTITEIGYGWRDATMIRTKERTT